MCNIIDRLEAARLTPVPNGQLEEGWKTEYSQWFAIAFQEVFVCHTFYLDRYPDSQDRTEGSCIALQQLCYCDQK